MVQFFHLHMANVLIFYFFLTIGKNARTDIVKDRWQSAFVCTVCVHLCATELLSENVRLKAAPFEMIGFR